jgi:hypothetical protein
VERQSQDEGCLRKRVADKEEEGKRNRKGSGQREEKGKTKRKD